MKIRSTAKAVLAIDPGGSKCEALLVAHDGTVLSHCRLRDAAVGGRHVRVIQRALAHVLHRQDFTQLIALSSGNGMKRRLLPPRWHGRARFYPATEALAALAAAGQTAGVVVIAGTGTRVAFRHPGGAEWSLDTLGPFLGDAGSGYYIGREALRTVARQKQLHHPPTRLHRRLFRACGCRSIPDLVRFSLLPRDRSLIASLARIVDDEANAGDSTARHLLLTGAQVMAQTVHDLVTWRDLAATDYPLVGAGSVAVHSTIYWRELCRAVRRFAPKLQPIRIPLPPVAGLAAMGLRRLNPNRSAAAIEKLFKEITP